MSPFTLPSKDSAPPPSTPPIPSPSLSSPPPISALSRRLAERIRDESPSPVLSTTRNRFNQDTSKRGLGNENCLPQEEYGSRQEKPVGNVCLPVPSRCISVTALTDLRHKVFLEAITLKKQAVAFAMKAEEFRLKAEESLAKGAQLFAEGQHISNLISEIQKGDARVLARSSAAEVNGYASVALSSFPNSLARNSEDLNWSDSTSDRKKVIQSERDGLGVSGFIADDLDCVEDNDSVETFTQDEFAALISSMSPRQAHPTQSDSIQVEGTVENASETNYEEDILEYKIRDGTSSTVNSYREETGSFSSNVNTYSSPRPESKEICPICLIGIGSRTKLIQHLNKVHSTIKNGPHECRICGEMFGNELDCRFHKAIFCWKSSDKN